MTCTQIWGAKIFYCRAGFPIKNAADLQYNHQSTPTRCAKKLNIRFPRMKVLNLNPLIN